MARVLLTAFEPFGPWGTNSSWLTLEQVTRELPVSPQVTTRRYPVDFARLRPLLERDLREKYDAVVMLGQASGRAAIELEAIGLNVACDACDATTGACAGANDGRALVEDGPVAYRTAMPIEQWARELQQAGLPVLASYHAGTYLCNAALYTTHYLIERLALPTQATFIHLPLDVSQTVGIAKPPASLPVEISGAAVRWILAQFADRPLA